MKTENELIIKGIDLEIESIKNSLLKHDEKFNRELVKNNIEYCIGYLEGKKELLLELENYINLRRSKLALTDLYDIFTDTNFSSDDIPF